MNIIAADAAGTQTRFLVADTDKPDEVLYEARYNSHEFDSFEPLLHTFIEGSGSKNRSLAALSLALPGVVKDNKASLAILPWSISKQVLRDQFGVEQVHFMNDFQASALGIPHLKQEDLICLNQRKHKRDATRVAVGSGTGQGVSWMLYDGFATRACSTEGGHVDFAPVDETRIDLLSFFSSVMVRVI